MEDADERESVRLVAGNAGLALSDEELERLVAAARRIKAMGAVVRRVIAPEVEPKPVFLPSSEAEGAET